MPLLTRSSWIKIILIAALCVVLCAGVVASISLIGLAGNYANSAVERIHHGKSFSERGDFVIPAQDIQSLEIVWLAGTVDIEVIDDDLATDDTGNLFVAATETISGSARGGSPMTWQVQDGVLEISFSTASGLAGCPAVKEKHLAVKLPRSLAQSLGTVDLTGASGTYHIGPIECELLNVDLASGRIEGQDISARTLNLDVMSGTVQLSGSFANEVDLDLASGNVDLTCPKGCPHATSFDIASGKVTLTIPANSGIAAKVDRISGSFSCDLPSDWVQTSNGITVFGDGANSLDVRITSGNVQIRPC